MPTAPPIVYLPADDRHQGGVWDGARAIVIHHTAGTNSAAWLSTTSEPPVSIHTLISRDGTLTRIVPPETQAYHVGRSVLGGYKPNTVCLGIELENLGNGQDYPPAQIDACGYEIAGWWRSFGVIPILTHALIDTTGKVDPYALDLARVFRAALAWYDHPDSPRYTPDSPILGVPRCTLPDLAARFPAPRGGYTTADIRRTILPAYWVLCEDVAVDPAIAIAQMAHETGALTSWWSQRPRRNPAGIGVTGETRPGWAPQPIPYDVWHYDPTEQLWKRGNVFGSWNPSAIRAHVGRLLAYALPIDSGAPLQRLLIAEALAVRPLADAQRGCAPTLSGLEGTWAVPGKTYAELLAGWANRLTGLI